MIVDLCTSTGDAARRERERTARAWGDPVSSALQLRDRQRLGELPDDRLRLAAYAGDEAARLLIGPGGGEIDWPTFDDDSRAPNRPHASWIRGLAPWGLTTKVRAAVAAARGALAADRSARRIDQALTAQQIDAADAWSRCPCPWHLGEWRTVTNAPCPMYVPIPWEIDSQQDQDVEASVHAAVRVLDRHTVRGLIAAALITYALGPAAA